MPTPNTPLTAWTESLRTVLGDPGDGFGVYDYPDAVLASGLRSVFALGKGPEGTELRDDADAAVTAVTLATATNVYPTLALNNPAFNELLKRAARVLLTPQAGAYAMSTRPLSVRDGGDGKRDLLTLLDEEIADIEAGGVFVFNPAAWDQDLESR